MTIPTLGYPSRREAIIALSQDGLTNDEIADKTGSSALSVRVTKSQSISSSQEKTLRVVVSRSTLLALTRAAVVRGIGSGCIAKQLIETCVNDKIIDAVLDDDAGAA